MVTVDRNGPFRLASRDEEATVIGHAPWERWPWHSREDEAGPTRPSDCSGEAFRRTRRRLSTSGNDDWDGLGMACTAAAGLLPIIEQVDARLLPEYLMRTLALRPPIPGPNGRDGISDIAAADHGDDGRPLRPSDRAARFSTGSPTSHRSSGWSRRIGDRCSGDEEFFEAAAVVDPARAAAMIDSLPESAGAVNS